MLRDRAAELHRAFAAGAGSTAIKVNPAVSERQRRFMGAELARKRAGKRTRTGMNATQLAEYAAK